jgi:hypothetical protein
MESKKDEPTWLQRLFKKGNAPEIKPKPQPTGLEWDLMRYSDWLEYLRDSSLMFDKNFVKELEVVFTEYQKDRALYKGVELESLDKTVGEGFENFGRYTLTYARYNTKMAEMINYISVLRPDMPESEDKAIVVNMDTKHFIWQLQDQAQQLLAQPSDYQLAYDEKYTLDDHKKYYERGWKKLTEYAENEINISEIGASLKGIYEEALTGAEKTNGEPQSIDTPMGELSNHVVVTREETISHLKEVFERAQQIRPDLADEYLREENSFLFTEIGLNKKELIDASIGQFVNPQIYHHVEFTPEVKELTQDFTLFYEKDSAIFKFGSDKYAALTSQIFTIQPDKSLSIEIYSEGNKETPVLRLNNITYIYWPTAEEQKAGLRAKFLSDLRGGEEITIPAHAIGAITTKSIGGEVKASFSEDLRPYASKEIQARMARPSKGKDLELYIGDYF